MIEYDREVARVKRRAYRDETYWGKPVPGFGDPNARLLIVGLAPGAHGANRTGRVFTGDSSGDLLYQILYETGFASQPHSTSRKDGLVLHGAYIAAGSLRSSGQQTVDGRDRQLPAIPSARNRPAASGSEWSSH